MKQVTLVILNIFLMMSLSGTIVAQKIDEERMNRDIEVAENVLETLIKQKFESKRMFFHLDVNGSYQEGYGITFTIPPDYTTPIAFSIDDFGDNVVVTNGATHVRRRSGEEVHIELDIPEEDENVREGDDKDKDNWRLKEKRVVKLDSLQNDFNTRVIGASTDFLVDYGDILSQLKENERIVITNRGERPRVWVGHIVNAPNRTHLSIELSKSALNQFKQGKLSRDQLISKIRVLSTQSVDEKEPDLELLSTIFNRLYRPDLSKSFFSDGNISYERLKDFGVIYYMQVYSSNRTLSNDYDMPTIKMRNVSQEERDKKVKELYPVFEKELQENILEYGRTLKSLSDEEMLIFNVKLTRCDNCGIPSSIEVSVKSSVLTAYGAGKINKGAALSSVTVKRTGSQ